MGDNVIRINFNRLRSELEKKFQNAGFKTDRAKLLAQIIGENSLYGKESHGLNRLPDFLDSVKKGVVKVNAVPEWIKSVRSIEQWDGKLGPGPLNAVICTDRAMELASEYGIGCVALKNTNHWMRGGTYGWRAAEAGYILICWSNTKPNMPAWGSTEPRLGNNPFVIAIPGEDSPIVLDMAMSQFSYGSMEMYSARKEKLPNEGGFDKSGKLTTDPDDIIASRRPLPAGLWKGAGMALTLDLIAALLTDGKSTAEIGKKKQESGVSQVFIAMSLNLAGGREKAIRIVNDIIADFHESDTTGKNIVYYPGERSMLIEKKYRKNGIPVDKGVWEWLTGKDE